MPQVIIISAPSGTGKSTIINRLLEQAPELRLTFSVSATSRAPRGAEQHGNEYYFLSEEEFRSRIAADEFLEYEEVYPGRFYGTLKSEVQRISAQGGVPIFDIDVAGGINMKRYYADDALAIFILPPSVEELRRRLEGRQTDSAEVIEERIGKAEQEIALAHRYDIRIVNDRVEDCYRAVRDAISNFLHKS